MDKEQMYDIITEILDRGNNVEIRRKNDGEISIWEVQKHRIKH